VAEAISSALEQTRPPDEVVVVDDGSQDGTADVVRAFGAPVRVVRRPHEGVAAGRNQAMAAATGEVWALLDADDRWRTTKLERQLAVLEERGLDAVFCQIDEFAEEDARAHRAPVRGVVAPIPSALLIRAEAARKVGPFDRGLTVGDWIDWWGRALQLGVRHGDVPEVLVERRLHGTNASLGHAADDRNEYLAVIRNRLQRARQAP
jgi:glycosyltransferase involved in cell wall biosynthesis